MKAIRFHTPFYEIQGTLTSLDYEEILIYDNEKALNKTNRSWLLDEINKTKRILPVWKDRAILDYFGFDITHTFALTREPENKIIEPKAKTSTPAIGKIFISHSSKDERLVNDFIDLILRLGIGVDRKNIFSTSTYGSNVKSGQDFRNAIKEELLGARVVIQIITPNYKKSEVCMNEMGAAWVLSDYVIPLVALPNGYDVGFINNSTQQLRLNSKRDLLKFVDEHGFLLTKEKIVQADLDKQLDFFLGKHKGIVTEDIQNPKEYFYDEEVKVIGTIQLDRYEHPFNDGTAPIENLGFLRYYYIHLDKPVDVLLGGFAAINETPNRSIRGVQEFHVAPETDSSVDLGSCVNQLVRLTGKLWGAFTGHHQRPVMMWVDSIENLDGKN